MEWLDCEAFASAPDAPDEGLDGYFNTIQYLDQITSAKQWASVEHKKLSKTGKSMIVLWFDFILTIAPFGKKLTLKTFECLSYYWLHVK